MTRVGGANMFECGAEARRSRTLRRNEKEEQEQKEDDKAINEKEKHECHDKEGSPESG